jgi:lipopolysaccharide/colanic/teichoic acid biosynthesis glycosyltransferase
VFVVNPVVKAFLHLKTSFLESTKPRTPSGEQVQVHHACLQSHACALILLSILFFCIYFLQKAGLETFFKMKKTTKMQKVFDMYAGRMGVQVS